MIRRLLSLLLPLSLGLAGAAQADPQDRPAPQPKVSAPRVLKPALWKVADADTTIYLFGTIHALPTGLVWLQGPVAEAFDRSEALVTEIPDVDPAAAQAVVLKRGTLPAGQSLRAMLSARQRRKFEAALTANKLPPAAFDRFKPWYAAVVLGTLPLVKNGYGRADGVEELLAARAKTQGQVRSGLETLDQQLALFDGLPPATQRDFLMAVIGESDNVLADLNTLVSEWGQGHAGKLAAMLNEEAGDKALTKALLADRNRAWAAWIKARLDQPGTVFVAVGAGHLAGKGSVQDDLAEAGIATTRVQ